MMAPLKAKNWMALVKPFGANVAKRRWELQNYFFENSHFHSTCWVVATNIVHTSEKTQQITKNTTFCEQYFLLSVFSDGN